MSGSLSVNSPYDGSLVEELPFANEAQIESYLATARKLADNPDAVLPLAERRAILERAANIIEERAEDYAKQAAAEGGKPLIDSRVEIARAVQGIRVALESFDCLAGEEIPMGLATAGGTRMAYTFREPIGVVVAISAFNHPFNLIIHQAVPAVAVGCPVIVKPALTTPVSARNICNVLYEAGLPKEWCQLAICEDKLSEKLVTDERVDFFTFIGSSRVGWYLRSKLSPGTHCALEHGGAAPVIVEADADLEDALPLLAKGGFYHAGQVCVSVQRVFVHNKLLDNFVSGLTGAAEKLVVGDPLSDKTEVGPLILEREVTRVAEWVDEAKAGGAKITCGGSKVSDTCYAPTILVNPPADAKVSTAEIFGPVVCVYGFDERADAISRANSLPFSFQASVFTKNIDDAFDTVKRLNACAVMVNDHTAFRVDWMPFGGRMESGLGVGGIPYTMRDMTAEKLFVLRTP